MEGLHVSALIENDMIFLQGRKYLLLVDTNTILHLAVYFKVYRIHQFDGRIVRFLHRFPLLRKATALWSANAYFVEFFQVGRINGYKVNAFIQRQGVIFRFQQNAVIE